MTKNSKFFKRYIRQQYSNTITDYCPDIVERKYYVLDLDPNQKNKFQGRTESLTLEEPLLYLNVFEGMVYSASVVFFTYSQGISCIEPDVLINASYFQLVNWPQDLIPPTSSVEPVPLPEGVEISTEEDRIEFNQLKITCPATIKNRFFFSDQYFDYFNFYKGRLLQTGENVKTTINLIKDTTNSVKLWADKNAALIATLGNSAEPFIDPRSTLPVKERSEKQRRRYLS